MEVLNGQVLSDAMTRCYENPGYKVCVAFISKASYISFVNELKKYATITVPGVEQICVGCSSSRMMFMNGSWLVMLNTNSDCHAVRVNELIYEDGLSKDVLNNALRPMLVPYRYERNNAFEREDDESGSDELDEFLRSFKVVP